MASIRITKFAGILPEVNAKLLPAENAQVAHNCVLADGSLRPQAQWIQLQEYVAGTQPTIRSIGYDWTHDAVTMYTGFDAVTLRGIPFQDNTTLTAGPNGLVNRYRTGSGFSNQTVAVYADGINGTVVYTRSYDSIKPVNRLYAITRVRRTGTYAEEGPMVLLNTQSPTDVLYEGDLVTIQVNGTALDDGANYFRIYRSISGLDTGQAVANEQDTKWHLVTEQPFYPDNLSTYVDGASATALPLDMNYSMHFHAPELIARYFGLSESGWFVTASLGGDIQISERYMHHAWPVENHSRIPDVVTAMAVHVDNVYLGTNDRPYVMALSFGDAAMQSALVPFEESIPCLPGTLAPSASGAIYASGQGLVALSREGMQVLTRQVANAGDILFSKKVSNGEAVASIGNTTHGAYYSGKYFGFCQGPPIDDGVYLTTTLYPVEYTESMRSEADLQNSKVLGTTIDHMTSEAELVEAALRVLLRSYHMPPNYDGTGEPIEDKHIYTECEFIEAELRTILHAYHMPPEEDGVSEPNENINLYCEGTLQTVVVERILIRTVVPTDTIDSSGTLLGGTLA